MDDYDPACPTEDDNQFAELDLSQVPLPPSFPTPDEDNDRDTTSISPGPPSELGKEGSQKRKRRKHEGSRPQAEEKDDKEVDNAEEQPVPQVPGPTLSHEDNVDTPVVEPVSAAESEIVPDTNLQHPPSAEPTAPANEDSIVPSSASTASTSPAPLPKPAKLHFKLAQDPSGGKAKVSFQLKKSLRSAFHAAEENEEETDDTVKDEVVKDIVEKTAAGEYIPTRFKVSKRHEMFRPSLIEPGITVVFNAPLIHTGGITNTTQTIDTNISPASVAKSHDVDVPPETESAATVKKDRATRFGRDARSSRKEDEEGKSNEVIDSQRGLRRSERRDRQNENNNSGKEDSSRSTRRSSRGSDRDRDRHDHSRASHSRRDRDEDRQKEKEDKSIKRDEDKQKEKEDKIIKSELGESDDRRRSARFRKNESAVKGEEKDSCDDKQEDRESRSSRKSVRLEHNPSPTSTRGRRTRSSHRSRSPSQERETTVLSSTEDSVKSIILEPSADLQISTASNEDAFPAIASLKEVASKVTITEEQPLPNKKKVAVVEIFDISADENIDKHPQIQKIVIRRTVDSSDFEIAKGDQSECIHSDSLVENVSVSKENLTERADPPFSECDKETADSLDKDQSSIRRVEKKVLCEGEIVDVLEKEQSGISIAEKKSLFDVLEEEKDKNGFPREDGDRPYDGKVDPVENEGSSISKIDDSLDALEKEKGGHSRLKEKRQSEDTLDELEKEKGGFDRTEEKELYDKTVDVLEIDKSAHSRLDDRMFSDKTVDELEKDKSVHSKVKERHLTDKTIDELEKDKSGLSEEDEKIILDNKAMSAFEKGKSRTMRESERRLSEKTIDVPEKEKSRTTRRGERRLSEETIDESEKGKSKTTRGDDKRLSEETIDESEKGKSRTTRGNEKRLSEKTIDVSEKEKSRTTRGDQKRLHEKTIDESEKGKSRHTRGDEKRLSEKTIDVSDKGKRKSGRRDEKRFGGKEYGRSHVQQTYTKSSGRYRSSSSEDESDRRQTPVKKLVVDRLSQKTPNPPLLPEQVLVDVSALPGKSKWEMDDEDDEEMLEDTVARNEGRLFGRDLKSFDAPSSRWSNRSPPEVVQRFSHRVHHRADSSSNEDEKSHEQKWHKDTKAEKITKKKRKDEDPVHSKKISEESEEIREGSMRARAVIDNSKIINYLREYSSKEDRTPKARTEIDNSTLVTYLKEYSEKMTTDSSLLESSEGEPDVSIEADAGSKKKNARGESVKSEIGRAAAVSPTEDPDSQRDSSVRTDGASTKKKEQGNSDTKVYHSESSKSSKRESEEKSENLEIKEKEKHHFEESPSRSSSPRERSQKVKSPERLLKEHDEKHSQKAKSGRSSSPAASERSASKSSQRSRDKRDRSVSVDKSKRSRRNRSRSAERKDHVRSTERRRGRRHSKSPSPSKGRDRRNKSRSVSQEKKIDRRNRSRSVSQEKKSDKRNRSRSVSHDKKSDRRNRSRSKSQEKKSDKRNRSRSISHDKKSDKRNRSRSISHEKKREISRSRSRERTYSYRSYRSPVRDSFGRTRRDRRGRSRSNSYERPSHSRTSRKHIKSKSPDKKGSKPSSVGEPDTKGSPSTDKLFRIKLEPAVSIDLSSIPIPQEIPLPDEEIQPSNTEDMQPPSSLGSLQDEPMLCSDDVKDAPMAESQVSKTMDSAEDDAEKLIPVQDSSKVKMTDIAEQKKGQTVNLATLPSGKERLIKFSIRGGEKKLKPIAVSEILGDDDIVEGKTTEKDVKPSLTLADSDEATKSDKSILPLQNILENVEKKEHLETEDSKDLQRNTKVETVTAKEVSDTNIADIDTNPEEIDAAMVISKNEKDMTASATSSSQPQRLKFKYTPLWELEKEDRKPSVEGTSEKVEGTCGLALDYGSGSSESEEDPIINRTEVDRVHDDLSLDKQKDSNKPSLTADTDRLKIEDNVLAINNSVDDLAREPNEELKAEEEVVLADEPCVKAETLSEVNETLSVLTEKCANAEATELLSEVISSSADHADLGEAYSPSHPSMEDVEDLDEVTESSASKGRSGPTSKIESKSSSQLDRKATVDSASSSSGATESHEFTLKSSAHFTTGAISTTATISHHLSMLPQVAQLPLKAPDITSLVGQSFLGLHIPYSHSSLLAPTLSAPQPVPPPSAAPGTQLSGISFPPVTGGPKPVPPPSQLGSLLPQSTLAFAGISLPPSLIAAPQVTSAWNNPAASLQTQPSFPRATSAQGISSQVFGAQGTTALQDTILMPGSLPEAPVGSLLESNLGTLPGSQLSVFAQSAHPSFATLVEPTSSTQQKETPVESPLSEAPPIKFRISRFSQGPPSTHAIPPPTVTIPPPSLALPTALGVPAAALAHNPASVPLVQQHATSVVLKSVDPKQAMTLPASSQKTPLVPASTTHSKRPKISSILSQPKIDDPAILETISALDVRFKPLKAKEEKAFSSAKSQTLSSHSIDLPHSMSTSSSSRSSEKQLELAISSTVQETKAENVKSSNVSSHEHHQPSEDNSKAGIVKSSSTISKEELFKSSSTISKEDLFKSSSTISKEDLFKSSSTVSKEELFKSSSTVNKEDLFKSSSSVNKEELFKSSSTVNKEELFKSSSTVSKEELPKPSQSPAEDIKSSVIDLTSHSVEEHILEPVSSSMQTLGMIDIPLPGEPVSHAPTSSIPAQLSGKTDPQLHPSSPPKLPPSSATVSDSNKTAPILSSPKGQTLGPLIDERKKRFSQSPLSIGMLPKVQITQSPLAAGPLPKFAPEREATKSFSLLPKKISSPGATDPKTTLPLILASKQKKPQTESEEPKPIPKVHFVFKSKAVVQRPLISAFDDEGSDASGDENQAASSEPSHFESNIISVFGEDRPEAQHTPAAALAPKTIPSTVVTDAEKPVQDRSTEMPVKDDGLEPKPKIVSLTDIEAFPVQVITSTRKEEVTPASSWPEFTVGKKDKGDEEQDRDVGSKSYDRHDKNRKRSRFSRDRDDNRDERKRKNRFEGEDGKKVNLRKNDDRRIDDENDNEYDSRIKIKKEKEDYIDRPNSGLDDRENGLQRSRHYDEDEDRKRGRDVKEPDSHRSSRFDDDNDYRRSKSRDTKEDKYSRRRSGDNREDDYVRRKYDDDNRRVRSFDRERTRGSSRERGRSRDRERNNVKLSGKRSHRSRDKSHSRSRSRSPSRRRDRGRDRSRDRYDREKSRSRSHERGLGSSSRRKDQKSFKEELLEELTKPSGKADPKDDLFKAAAINCTSQSYAFDYHPEPVYSSSADNTYSQPPHHGSEVATGYHGQDPNLATPYAPSYDHQQYDPHWQNQPAPNVYNQVLPPQHSDMSNQYPPNPPEQAIAPHPYPFQPISTHYTQTNYQNNQPLQESYHQVPSILHQQIPQHPASGPQPPHFHMDQHGQMMPPHYSNNQHLAAAPLYPPSGPQNNFQPPTFSQDSIPSFAPPDFHSHFGPRPRTPLLPNPVRTQMLRIPSVSHNIIDTSNFGSPKVSSPEVISSVVPQNKSEIRPSKKFKFGMMEEGSFSPVIKSSLATSSSPTVGSPSTSSMTASDAVHIKPTVADTSFGLSMVPEPSFETSLLAESEFDSTEVQEAKKSPKTPIYKKKNSLEVNEPTVSSSGVEDSTGDTGSDSGTDSSSQRPLKVKSRWRRNSEAEAVVDTSTSLPPILKQVLSRITTPTDTPDSSPKERRRTRSRAAAEEFSSQAAQITETPPPPPPPRKRVKLEPDAAENTEELETEVSRDPQEDGTKVPESEVLDLASIMARPDFPKFEIIPENIHLTERKRSKSMKRMLCDCTTSREERSKGLPACGSDCLNRMLMIECNSRCPCGDYCTNKRFQKKQYSLTAPFKAGDKGWGLVAEEEMEEKGTFIMEYVGELLDYEEFVRRTRQYSRSGLVHHYFMALNADEVVDATLKGSISRFINHSCDPNCETQKWTVNGELRVGFFTRKPIKKGEELTFDYQFEHYGEAQKCYCGSENCRGFIGLVKSLTRNNRRKEKKKKEIFKDELLEEDIAKLSLLDGMRNKNHVLDLCRLMVRAEKVQHRMAILKILQDTAESACLRLFLDYHGLPLLWSWMADIGTTDYSPQTQELKLLMLSVLKSLPITNKTALKESKIPDMVDRWAVAAVVAARKPPPPPPPATTMTTLIAKATKAIDSLASITTVVDNEAVATAEATTSVEEAGSVEEDAEKAAEPEATTSSESSPPASPPPLLPPLLSTITPVSILASAKDSKDAKRKRRVTFAEIPIESEFSPEPLGVDENDDISSSTQSSGDKEGLEDVRSLIESGDISGIEGQFLAALSPGEATASGNKRFGIGEGNVLKFHLKPDEGLSGDVADSTSQKYNFDSGGSSGTASDADNSDTETLIKDPLASLAAECVSLWSTLKEVFKIPKRERVEERKRTERELDVLSKKDPETSDPFAKWKKSSKVMRLSKRKVLEDDERKLGAPKMSKEERRQLFEAQVKAEDEMVAQAYAEEYQRQQEAYILHQQRLLDDPQYFYFHQQHQGDPNFAGMDPSMIPPEGLTDPISGESLIDPHTGQSLLDMNTGQQAIDPNTGQPIIDQNTGRLLVLHSSQIDPNTGQPMGHTHHIDPQTGQPVHHLDPHTGQLVNHLDPITGQLIHQIDPLTGQPLHQIDPITGQPLHQIDPITGQPHHIDPITGQPLHQLDPITRQPITSQIDPSTGQPIQHQMDPILSHPHIQSGHPHFDPHLVQPHPVHNQTVISSYQQQPQAQHLSGTPQSQSLLEVDFEEEVPPPPSPPTVPASKLPPNWKTAKDSEGRVYYYHAFTRQTQWEMPNWDDNEEDSDDMDLDPNPMDELIKTKKKTTTAAADTSSEVARKIKDQFRSKMSNFIVTYLNPYRKQDCKIGRIVSTDDFKHLARKLTHHVMSKELKHCRHVEDLEVNENVKAKAKDYVRKYMGKFGSIFKKSSSPHPDDASL